MPTERGGEGGVRLQEGGKVITAEIRGKGNYKK